MPLAPFEFQIERVEFYAEWLATADRIGWWLRHESPPADTAASAVIARISAYAAGLVDHADDAEISSDRSVHVGVIDTP